jgi:hypothetical protein
MNRLEFSAFFVGIFKIKEEYGRVWFSVNPPIERNCE